jgi:integrase
MPSITTRQTTSGPRYVVRYRLGGRAFGIQHGGSFKTMKEARARRDLIAGELAGGRNPGDLLRAMTEVPNAVRNFAEVAEAYGASRVDHAPETAKGVESHLKKILPTFRDRDPHTIRFSDVQAWIGGLGLKPSSVAAYVATLRQVLDFAEVDPNPARDRRVKLPSIVVEEPKPPTGKQFLAILDAIPKRWILPLIVLEQTACRAGELASLAWGDVDAAECKFRLRSASTKSRRARWVQLPAWVMEEIEATCPLEDRTAERRVFPGCTVNAVESAMARACVAAKVGHFHPHDLRHRRITIWHHDGIPARVLAERAGHARASMSLDVYSHVMRLDECDPEALQTRILVARRP